MPMRTAARKIVASNWSSGEEYPSRTRQGAVPCTTGRAVCLVDAIVRPDTSASCGLIAGFDRKRANGDDSVLVGRSPWTARDAPVPLPDAEAGASARAPALNDFAARRLAESSGYPLPANPSQIPRVIARHEQIRLQTFYFHSATGIPKAQAPYVFHLAACAFLAALAEPWRLCVKQDGPSSPRAPSRAFLRLAGFG